MEKVYTCVAFLILVLFVISKFGNCQPSYAYNCSGTFLPNEGIIETDGTTSCEWKLVTHPGDVFQLTFFHFLLARRLSCNDGYVEVRYESTSIRYCTKHNSHLPIVTGNHVTIRSSKGISFSAKIPIDSDNAYSTHDSSQTWIEATEACARRDTVLAETYPVVTLQLHDHFFSPQRVDEYLLSNGNGQIYNLARRYWIGMSLTPWIKYIGCVQIIEKGIISLPRELKNNKMTECAIHCSQYSGFILSGHLCQCLSETNDRHFSVIPNTRCTETCPGNQDEICGDGGVSVHTLYEFFHGKVEKETDSKHCVIKVGKYYITEDCQSRHGFTCRLENGTKETFYPSLPGKNDVKTKSLSDAIKFCTNYPNAINMASEPKFPDQYFNESYWTTISRGIVWNPSQGSKDTKYSYVATVDMVKMSVVTRIAKSTDQHGYICQHANKSCGGMMCGDVGNISSINYPRNYDDHLTCKWQITVNETNTIKIEIIELDIEENEDCTYDYLKVTESDTLPITLCGIWKHKVIQTKSNEVMLTMKTDDTVSGKGFYITWTSVDIMTSSNTGSAIIPTSSLTWKGAAIAGIVFGGVMLVLAGAAIIGFVHVKKRRNSNPNRNQSNHSTSHNAMYGISSSFDSSSHITIENNGSTRQQNAANVYDSITEENTSRTDPKSLYSGLSTAGCEDNDGYLLVKDNPACNIKAGASKTVSDASNKYLNADLPSDLRTFKKQRYPSEKNGSLYDEVDESRLCRENPSVKDNTEYATIV